MWSTLRSHEVNTEIERNRTHTNESIVVIMAKGLSSLRSARLLLLSCVGTDAHVLGRQPPAALLHVVGARRRSSSPACSGVADKSQDPQHNTHHRTNVGLPKSVAKGNERADFLRAVADRSSLPGSGGAPFTVLGIETSCDDTGVAIVRSDGTILGEALASQAALHEEWGGVVPGIARDAHAEALDRVVAEALRNANMSSVDEVDAIGVTVGPGLEICLRVGCEGAKALALAHDKPFVGVHHLEAHVLMARLATGAANVPFPFLTLLTSGGHCQLLLTTAIGEHAVLGSTLDDALGEAFDKVARLLELPIGGGGGPALEKLAREGDRAAIPLPIPMQNKKTLDFSFAGLKTAVRVAVQKTDEATKAAPRFSAITAVDASLGRCT